MDRAVKGTLTVHETRVPFVVAGRGPPVWRGNSLDLARKPQGLL
jgi:hypothetical protein